MNTKRILTGFAIAGGLYAIWRFVIKPQLAESEAKKLIADYEIFDTQREIIAQALPQDTQTNEKENFG